MTAAFIETRFEVLVFNQYSNIRDGFRQIYKKENLKWFYQGTLTTIIRDVTYIGILFHELSKRFIVQKEIQINYYTWATLLAKPWYTLYLLYYLHLWFV